MGFAHFLVQQLQKLGLQRETVATARNHESFLDEETVLRGVWVLQKLWKAQHTQIFLAALRVSRNEVEKLRGREIECLQL